MKLDNWLARDLSGLDSKFRAQFFPELRSEMRRERIEQDQQRAHRCYRNFLHIGKAVNKNHHLGNGGIERKRLDVLADFLDGGVNEFELRFIGRDVLNPRRQFPFARLVFVHHQPPDSRQKS